MKAITLWQPWASLVACGAKQYETRTWEHGLPAGTLLAIHAAKRGLTYPQSPLTNEQAGLMCEALRDNCSACRADDLDPWQNLMNAIQKGYLPLGEVVAVVRTGSSVMTDSVRGPEAFRSALISDTEELFGDYSPGRWAWELELVKRLDKPIPARGGQRLWNWEPPEWLLQELKVVP